MNIEDFDINLMATKTIFHEAIIKPGLTIRIYRVNPDAKKSTFVTKGIITYVDHITIKYSYFSASKGDMLSAYLYAHEVVCGELTDSQWEEKEELYIFTLED